MIAVDMSVWISDLNEQNDHALLHDDRDFDQMAQHLGLRVTRPMTKPTGKDARIAHKAARELRDLPRQAATGETGLDFDAPASRLRARTADRRHTPAEILRREGRDER